MATPNNATLPTGVPIAQPVYLVDPTANGSPYAAGGGGVGSTVTIADPTTPANKLAVDGAGKIGINSLPTITATNPSVGTDGSAIPTSSTLIGASDGTNLQQLLVESASNRNLRAGIYSGANEATVTGSNALKVDNSAVTQPVSAASLPLPTGASTSAKQPAIGTAGTASTDVLTVQGIASMTAIKTDGSGVTQPVSGTVTMNAGSGTMAVNQATASSLNATATIQAVTGTSLGADQTNSILKVSNYVKSSGGTAADTVLTLGQATMAASQPVVIASNQTVIPITRSTVAAYTLASTTTTGATQNSGDIAVGPYTEIAIDINTTAQAGTSPTIQYFYERKGADSIYYILWQSAVLTTATNTLSTSIGAGMAYNQSLGVTGRVRWVVGGSATPTFTHTISIQGK